MTAESSVGDAIVLPGEDVGGLPDLRPADRVPVAFSAHEAGVGELSWGQRDLWLAMLRQNNWMPLGGARPVEPGTTVQQIADELRYLMTRFPALRTRLRHGPDGRVGRRQNAAALRYWENLIRQIPLRRIPAPGDAQRQRRWCAEFTSPALRLGLREIADRTNADSSTVLMALYAVALARITGVNPVV